MKHGGPSSQRTAARPAVWVVVSSLVCVLATVPTAVLLGVGAGRSTPGDGFGLGGWGGVSFLMSAVAFGTVGALVATRLPGHRVGRVFCFMGATLGVGDLSYQYADQSLYGPLEGWPGGVAGAWLQNVALTPSFGLLGLAVLIFPDGRLPSRRWRLALVPSILGSVLLAVGYALRPGRLDDPFDSVMNPSGVPGTFTLMDVMTGIGWLLSGSSVVLAAVAMSVRLRRARGPERAQLKWVAFAGSVAGVLIAADVVSFFVGLEGINSLRIVGVGVGLSALPAAAGVAILRYRLYDIDVVINRTLVYGTLTASLASVYLGSVLLLQVVLSPFTEGSSLAIAVSTLAVAALFRPARLRIQQVVDRRFFRARYDAGRTLERFGTHLRDQVNLTDIGDDLVSVVSETVRPSHVALWLRTSEAGR